LPPVRVVDLRREPAIRFGAALEDPALERRRDPPLNRRHNKPSIAAPAG
jgi:hypothetical protein